MIAPPAPGNEGTSAHGEEAGSRSWPAAAMQVAPLLGLTLLMARLVKAAAGPLSNSDTWFHLSLGRAFWGPWSLPHPGRLSSFATSPWVPTQWSTEMLASKFEQWFGLSGVAWLFGALFVGFLVAVYAACRDHGSPLPAVVATGLAVVASADSLSARPQVVSLAMLAVCNLAWARTGRDLRARWWLIPLTWVWATAHGLWSAGILLGLGWCVGFALDRRLMTRRECGRLLAIPVLSLAAAAATPVGPRLLLSQINVSARAPLISEWAPTSFRELPALAAAIMVGAIAVLWARRGGLGWTPLLILAMAFAWIASSSRMVGVGAVIAAPLLTAELQRLLPDRAPLRLRSEVCFVATAGTVCLAGLAVAAPHTASRPAGVPVGLSSRIASLPPGSPVLVADPVGAWIEWRFPTLNPIIDGMFDAYPVNYMRSYASATAVGPGWQRFVKRTGATVGVLPRQAPLTIALEQRLGWKVVRESGAYVFVVQSARGAPGDLLSHRRQA